MSLLNSILNAAGGGVLDQVGRQFGLNQSSTQNIVGKLLPALMSGLKRNTASPGGIEALQNALKNGSHQRYLDDTQAVAGQDAVLEGNKILGHLLGSKDASRAVASQAAEGTGIDVGVIKKLLPMVASMAMGALSKETGAGAKIGGSGGGLGALAGLLDSDGDGSIFDDLLSKFGKGLLGR